MFSFSRTSCGFLFCLCCTRNLLEKWVGQGGAWLGGALLQVGAGFKAAGGLEIERLRHLVLCARLLMRDEEAKRLSVSLKRHVSFT